MFGLRRSWLSKFHVLSFVSSMITLEDDKLIVESDRVNVKYLRTPMVYGQRNERKNPSATSEILYFRQRTTPRYRIYRSDPPRLVRFILRAHVTTFPLGQVSPRP